MPPNDFKETSLSGPEESKQDINESNDTIMNQSDRKKPPKKRLAELQSSDDDADREGANSEPRSSSAASSDPSNKNIPGPTLSIEERRKEARRASNRASAARTRKRQKLTVQVLENMLLKQKQESQLLRRQLDAALAENQQLRLMLAEEQQVTLDRNRSLQHSFNQSTLSSQRAFRGEPPGNPSAPPRSHGLVNRNRPTAAMYEHASAPRSHSLPLSSHGSHQHASLALNQGDRYYHDETAERREAATAALGNVQQPPRSLSSASQLLRQEAVNQEQPNQAQYHGYASSAQGQVERYSSTDAQASVPPPEAWIKYLQNQITDLKEKTKNNQS